MFIIDYRSLLYHYKFFKHLCFMIELKSLISIFFYFTISRLLCFVLPTISYFVEIYMILFISKLYGIQFTNKKMLIVKYSVVNIMYKKMNKFIYFFVDFDF